MPVVGATGAVVKWLVSATDIQTTREALQLEAALTEELEDRVRLRTDELRAANAKNEANAAKLQTAQRIAQIGSWELDVASGRVGWSAELYRVFGLDPRDEAPNYLEQASLFEPESWVRLSAAVERAIAHGEGYQLALTMRRVDGTTRSALANAQVLTNSTGQVDRLVGTVQDTTERDAVGVRLEVLTERLQLATSAAEMGVWDWDIRSGTMIWDSTMRELYKTGPSAPIGLHSWSNALHPDDRASAEGALAEALAGRAEFRTTFRIVDGAGQLKHLRAEATVHRDANGEPLRMVGVNWNVTEQRLAELTLKSTEALQRAILSHAGSAIIATDCDGTITLFNRAAEDMLGYRSNELVGRANAGLFHEPTEVDTRRITLEYELGVKITSPFEVFVIESRSGVADAREWTYVRKDRTRLPVWLTVTSLRDAAGHVVGFLGVAVDLSRQKQTERELRALNELLAVRSREAESASRAKSAFVANMSHEIRTPLGAISGISYLLGKTRLDAEQTGLVRTIERSSKTLARMINDVLMLSKIEAQQLTLNAGPFELGAAVDELSGLMAGFAVGKPLELVVNVEPTLPEHLVGDRMRVMQILTNLVGNAIKFTDVGMVHVWLRAVARDASTVRLRAEVRDDGPGIDESSLPKLFTRFAQAETPASIVRGGTGLGLAIVKELVTLMGGQFGVTSAPGEGSTFWFELTLGFAASPSEATQGRLLVLIGDNHLAAREALLAAASRLGWSATAPGPGAPDPNEGSGAQPPVDALIVADAGDGHAADEMARWSAAGRPAVVLVTRGSSGAGARCALPVDATVHAPVTSSALRDAVQRAKAARLGVSSAAEGQPQLEQVRRLPGVRALVVDDDEVNRVIAGRILELEGAIVTCAENGQQAFEAIRDSTAPYDVVLMDVQMPVLNGIEATRKIRQLPSGKSLPVIAVSAGALTKERDTALATGMTDFVSKPFDPPALIANVRAHIENARKAPLAPRIVKQVAEAPAWPFVDGIEGAEVAARLGGDRALFFDLLKSLVRQTNDFDAWLGDQQHDLQSGELAARAHKLRGAAGNLGARCLQTAAFAVETSATQRLEDLPQGLRQLRVELARVRGSAQGFLGLHRPRTSTTEAQPTADLLQNLVALLQERDLAALEVFTRLSSNLQAQLGVQRHALLQSHIEELDFATALSLLTSRVAEVGSRISQS